MAKNAGVSLHMGYRKDAGTATNIDTLKVNILNDNKIPWWKFWKKKKQKSIDEKNKKITNNSLIKSEIVPTIYIIRALEK